MQIEIDYVYVDCVNDELYRLLDSERKVMNTIVINVYDYHFVQFMVLRFFHFISYSNGS